MGIELVACDTAVDRFATEEREAAFNITGTLSTDLDTQFVRVQRIRDTIEPDTLRPLDATVTLSDLDTGESRMMTDSLVGLDDGTRGHLMFLRYEVQAGHRYEIRIEGSDGPTTVATTAIPPRPETTVSNVETAGSATTQSITWLEMTKTPNYAAVVYSLASDDQSAPSDVVIAYTLRGSLGNSGWTTAVRLSDDQRIARQQLDIRQDDRNAVFSGIRMQIRILSDEWSDSKSGENIVGGVGFFGSTGDFTEEWILDEEAVSALGFVDGQEP